MFDFKKLKSWDTVLWLILSILFVYVFVENFVLSSSFDIIQLRDIDDMAFNVVLNYWHNELSRFNIPKLMNLNNFGYGNVFWTIHGLVTFPFHLIHNEQLIVAAARNISLISGFASFFFLHRILGNYTASGFYKMVIILTVASTQVFATYVQCFDNATLIMFFGILGIYFLVKEEDLSKKNLIYSAISIAAAVGTKLTGCFIIPLAGVMLLDKLHFNFSKENIKKIWLYIWVFFIAAIFFTNPGLLLFFLYKEEVKSYFDLMVYYIQRNSENVGGADNANILHLFKNGIGATMYGVEMFFVFIMLYIVKIAKDIKDKQYHFIYYLISVLFVVIGLLMSVRQGPAYVSKYFTVVFAFLPFSLLALEKFKKMGYFILMLLFSCVFYINNVIPRSFFVNSGIIKVKSAYTGFYAAEKSDLIKRDLSVLNDLKGLVPNNKNKNNRVVIVCDYRSIPPYSVFRENFKVITTFDDISLMENEGAADYIIINEKSLAFLPDEEISKLGFKDTIFASKKIIQNLMKNETYLGSKYELIYDKHDTIMYKKI